MKVVQDLYWMNLTVTVPDNYPLEQVRYASVRQDARAAPSPSPLLMEQLCMYIVEVLQIKKKKQLKMRVKL